MEQSGSESKSSLNDVDSPHMSSIASNFSDDSSKTDTQSKPSEKSQGAHTTGTQDGPTSQQNPEKKDSSKDMLKKNADNPILIGNLAVMTALLGVLGWSGWRWGGQQGPKGAMGAVAGAAAALGIYGGARWALNKYYPPRK